MKVVHLLLALAACGTLGCASGLMEPAVEQSALRLLAATSPGRTPASDEPTNRMPPRALPPAMASDEPEEPATAAAASDEPLADEPLADEFPADEPTDETPEAEESVDAPAAEVPSQVEPDDEPQLGNEVQPEVEPQRPDENQPDEDLRLSQAEPSEPEMPGMQPETIQAPAPVVSKFKPASEDEPENRFDRSVASIAVDIRPPIDNGNEDLPKDVAKAKFDEQAAITPDSLFRADSQIVVGPTPWSFCFRPLYFEEVYLERYGTEHGLLQSGISGTQFFVTFAALPYKMTVRPPRSCVCSNGFSRCGDQPPANYGRWYWRWDAALVELAAVSGVVFFLP